MAFTLPPIVKCAERLMLEIEQAVRSFPRYHKYTVGTELRTQAMHIARLAHRAWRARLDQAARVDELAAAIDDLKLSLQLGQQIKAFSSFGQFEALARTTSDLGRQCGGWQKKQRAKGQNERPPADVQRAQILSTRAASQEANP